MKMKFFPEIPMNKPIKVMSLYTGGLNLKKYDSDKTPVRFNRFGEVHLFYIWI